MQLYREAGFLLMRLQFVIGNKKKIPLVICPF